MQVLLRRQVHFAVVLESEVNNSGQAWLLVMESQNVHSGRPAKNDTKKFVQFVLKNSWKYRTIDHPMLDVVYVYVYVNQKEYLHFAPVFKN